MFDTITRYLEGVKATTERHALRRILNPLGDRYSSQAVTSAGMVIASAGAWAPKIGATDFYAVVTGQLVKLAAGTVLPAPAGITIPPAVTAVICYFIDNAGTVTTAGGTPGLTLATAVFPQFPVGKALLGFIIIINGGGGFNGGSTALDLGPYVFVSPVGAFDPTVLV